MNGAVQKVEDSPLFIYRQHDSLPGIFRMEGSKLFKIREALI
jgi:hypothetical protein